MKPSLFVSALAGVLFTTAPAFARHEPKVAPEPPQPVMSSYVDPDVTHDPENVLFLDLSNGGHVAIRLMPQWAPNHVERIKVLTHRHFYDGLIFHRVIDGFMAQTGDPTGTGSGGSDLPNLKAEFNSMPHLRGTVSMARTQDPDSANSQFFIVFYPRFALDHNYTNFGRVIAGMDAVDKIERGEPPANPTKIVRAWLEKDDLPPLPVAATPPAPLVDEAKGITGTPDTTQQKAPHPAN